MLEAKRLTVELGRRIVVRGLSVKFARGQVTAVIGPNGAGKSTLLRALAGLVKPSDGSVEVEGQDQNSFTLRDLGRRIAYLPQDRAVAWPLSAEAVVALGRLPYATAFARNARRDIEAVSDALARVDAAHLRKRPVTELSGGERARVLIARALAQEAPALIADEPTSGLDPAHALSLFQHLARLAESGRCVVVATHDLSMALRFADEVVLMNGGRIAASGDPTEVFNSAELIDGFSTVMAVGEVEGVPAVLPLEIAPP